MLQAGRLRGDAALALLLAARVVAAFEPITVGLAIGAASIITSYLTYDDIYCRFAECCREERPLNASGTARARAAGRRCWGRRGLCDPWRGAGARRDGPRGL
ncbi:torsin-1B-like [Cebus imitator]|uniref:torsin-1B-like n=1 Tax=Cebus imitator TaxID=2715852 RepID=UPI00080A65CD|nr:torsin-1B-like [Cebus imitator]